MKTTVEIADPLLEAAKSLAAREGVTLRAVIERGLRAVLEERDANERFELRKASVPGNGLQPGARDRSWEALRDMAYGERGGR